MEYDAKNKTEICSIEISARSERFWNEILMKTSKFFGELRV